MTEASQKQQVRVKSSQLDNAPGSNQQEQEQEQEQLTIIYSGHVCVSRSHRFHLYGLIELADENSADSETLIC
ncbi:MAG: hypothetical protein AAFQ63_10375 [Cyanobacteria bacterium J06621_11]